MRITNVERFHEEMDVFVTNQLDLLKPIWQICEGIQRSDSRKVVKADDLIEVYESRESKHIRKTIISTLHVTERYARGLYIKYFYRQPFVESIYSRGLWQIILTGKVYDVDIAYSALLKVYRVLKLMSTYTRFMRK